MMHILIVSNRHNARDADCSRKHNAAQVVAQQVDDHDVFGSILFAMHTVQNLAGDRPPAWRARPSALDRPCFDVAVLDVQKPFRRRTSDHEVAEIEIAGERSGFAFTQPPV